MERKTASWRGLILLTLAATLGLNALATLLPLGGKTTGEISDQYAVYFVPEGYVFSIWGVIYALLILYALYAVFLDKRWNKKETRTAKLFVLSNVFNSVWILLWQYEYIYATVAVMVALLLTLIFLYRSHDFAVKPKNAKEFLFMRLPFSIYLGWITVATIANVTIVLYVAEWSGWGIAPQNWSAIMIGVATLLGTILAVRFRDAAYAAVLIWAFIGIANKFPNEQNIVYAVWMGVGLLAVIAAFTLYQRVKNPLTRSR